jgi:hypothetical protein
MIFGVAFLGVLGAAQLARPWRAPGVVGIVLTFAVPLGILWLMRRDRGDEARGRFGHFFEAAFGIAMVVLIISEFWRVG